MREISHYERNRNVMDSIDDSPLDSVRAGAALRLEADRLFGDHQWGEALDRYRAAGEIYALEPIGDDRAYCLRRMVACLVPLGRYSEALGLGSDALALIRSGDDRVGEALLLEDLAQALAVFADSAGLQESIRYLDRAEGIYSTRGEQVRRCQVVGRQALLHERAFLIGEGHDSAEGAASLATCERLVEEALRLLYSSALSLDPTGIRFQELKLLSVLARCRYHNGRWRSAADRFAVSGAKAAALDVLFVADQAMWAYSLFRLSTDPARQMLSDARDRVKSALTLEIHADARQPLAEAYQNISAALELAVGSEWRELLAAAISSIRTAVQSDAHDLLDQSLVDAIRLLEQATGSRFITESRQLLADALARIDTAIKQCARVGDFEEIIQTFVLRGDINWEMGHLVDAARDYEIAFHLIDERPFLFSRPLDRVAVLRRYERLFPRIVEAYARAAKGDERHREHLLERAFHFSERSRAVALSDLLALADELLGRLPEDLRGELQASEREQREAYLHNEVLMHSMGEEVRSEAARGRLWAAEERLRQMHARAFAAVPSLSEATPRHVTSLVEVVEALPHTSDIAILQFTTAENCICVFVVTKTAPTTCLILDSTADTGRNETRYRSRVTNELLRGAAPFFDNYERFAKARKEYAELSDSGAETNKFTTALKKEKWKKQWIRGLDSLIKTARVLLSRESLDGGPSLLAVLRSSDIRHVVIVPDGVLQRVPFHAILYDFAAVTYSPSSSILIRTAQRLHKRPSSVLIVDNPDATLEAAGFEAALVAARFSTAGIRVHRLSGADATPAAVLAQMPEHDFTHYCGHASSDLASPWESCLELAARAGAGGERMSRTGTLSARELMLRGAVRGGAVAVVNGCSTGVAPANAPTEFVGLPAAFLASGYSVVLSTLCEVAAHTPALIMDILMARLLAGNLSYAEALRGAALEIKSMTDHALVAYAKQQAASTAATPPSEFSAEGTANLLDWPPSHPIHWLPFVIWGAAWSSTDSHPRPNISKPVIEVAVPTLHGASGDLLLAVKRAYTLQQKRRYQDAVHLLTYIVRTWGPSFFTHSSMARAYSGLGDLERVRYHELEALRYDRVSPMQHFNLGCIYMDLGFLAEARDCFTEALRLNSAYAEAWSNLAALTNDVPVVLRYYREALSTKPTDPNAITELRRWEKLSGTGHPDLAKLRLRWAQQALDRRDYSLARLQLSLAQELSGQDSEGLIADMGAQLRVADERGSVGPWWHQ